MLKGSRMTTIFFGRLLTVRVPPAKILAVVGSTFGFQRLNARR